MQVEEFGGMFAEPCLSNAGLVINRTCTNRSWCSTHALDIRVCQYSLALYLRFLEKKWRKFFGSSQAIIRASAFESRMRGARLYNRAFNASIRSTLLRAFGSTRLGW